MATPFNTSFNEALPPSDTGAKMKLATNTALTFTVPGTGDKKYRARFSYTSDASVWVAINKTAVSPVAGTVVDSYNEEFRPDVWYVKGGDVLSFVSSDTGSEVGVSLLQIPN